jgi:hypothetical protein
MNVSHRARQILVLGLGLVLFGLLWGLAVPHTPYPRLALGAHMQFTANGVLFIVMAVLLLALPHNVSARSATVMLVAAMVPIALGQGPGAGARASMAKVIIGGQMLSLVLALLVTPVFYALLDMMVNLSRRLGIRFSVELDPDASPHSSSEIKPVPEGA